MAILQDLIQTITQPQYVQILLTALQANGVPTNQFKDSTQIDYAFTQVISQCLADLRLSETEILSSVFLQYASGTGLDLFAPSQYQISRLTTSPTVGIIRLIAAPSAPQYTFAPGDLTLSTQGTDPNITKSYTNSTGGTLMPGGTLDLTWTATQPGSIYNIPNTTTLVLTTAKVGVSVSNPLYPLASTWITTQGTDAETDSNFVIRCISRWGTLGAGGNAAAYLFWALGPVLGGTTSPVYKAEVVSNLYNGQFFPAFTTVYVIGPNGPLSNSDLAHVQANFENPQKYPAGFSVQVLNADIIPVPVTGIVYVYRSANVSLVDVQASVEASLLEYQGTLTIGDQSIYPQKIATWISAYPANSTNIVSNIDSIRNVQLSAPGTIVNLAYNQYPQLQYTAGNLIYQLV